MATAREMFLSFEKPQKVERKKLITIKTAPQSSNDDLVQKLTDKMGITKL